MKILHVSYKSKDEGAAIAATRLVQAQREYGMKVDHLVITDSVSKRSEYILFRFFLFVQNRIDKYFRSKKSRFTSVELCSYDWVKHISFDQYEIVHLHWLHRGFVNDKLLESILTKKVKLFLSMHDFRYITGACHIPYDCMGYQDECLKCPQVDSHRLVAANKRSRNRILGHANLHFFCPSEWVAKIVTNLQFSDAGRVHLVPNTLDIDVFSQGKNTDKKTFTKIGFLVSNDERKGLKDVLRIKDLFGSSESYRFYGIGGELPSKEVFVSSLGLIREISELVDFYRDMDVILLPATNEPFGQMVAEAICCGTPVVCYEGSGPDSIVEHKLTGYIAKTGNLDDLGEGIKFCKNLKSIPNTNLRLKLSENNIGKLSFSAYHS